MEGFGSKMNKCMKCNKKISQGHKHCRSCAQKERIHKKTCQCIICIDTSGINNGKWKGGKEARKILCKDCNKELNMSAYFEDNIRCKSCARIEQYRLHPETNPMLGRKGNLSPNFGKISHGKGQWYKDCFMRSSWEILFAKFLDFNNIAWLYEPKAFDLGNCTYTPDFYLPETNEYIEIKGWWRDDALLKYNLTKIFYPQEKIQVLMQKDLQECGILK
jgi:hypothetical protein